MTTQTVNAFMQALATKSQAIKPQPKPKKNTGSAPTNIMDFTKDLDPIRVTVDVVLDRNRLDVFFSRKPDAMVLDDLRNNGFHYRPTDSAWYHKDTKQNRELLNNRFNAGLEIEQENQPVIEVVPEVVPSAEIIEDTPFENYKRQISDLMQELRLESCADLQLLAIDCLHRQTFARN